MTTQKSQTLQVVLDRANPNEIADVFRKMKLGHLFASVKVTVTGLSATQNIDITVAAVKAAATIAGLTLDTGENLPPIWSVIALRVTASGTGGSLGTYGISDAGGTAIVPPGGAGAAMGIATLSDDGKTLGFPNTITAFVLEYIPRPYTAMSAAFPST